ncbi:MAG TPA: hypothetical protein DCY12_00410 [Candidatus Atribacteria bacterium]|nr:hypothetical protein [Candidatus Atribacteria bacterium]
MNFYNLLLFSRRNYLLSSMVQSFLFRFFSSYLSNNIIIKGTLFVLDICGYFSKNIFYWNPLF